LPIFSSRSKEKLFGTDEDLKSTSKNNLNNKDSNKMHFHSDDSSKVGQSSSSSCEMLSGDDLSEEDAIMNIEEIKNDVSFHLTGSPRIDRKKMYLGTTSSKEKKKILEKSSSRSLDNFLMTEQENAEETTETEIETDTEEETMQHKEKRPTKEHENKSTHKLNQKNVSVKKCNDNEKETGLYLSNWTRLERGAASNYQISPMSISPPLGACRGSKSRQERCEQNMKLKSVNERCDNDFDEMEMSVSPHDLRVSMADKYDNCSSIVDDNTNLMILRKHGNTSCRNEEKRVHAFIIDDEVNDVMTTTEEAG